jgi:hypothetical protein
MSPAQLDRGPKWTADEDHKMLEMVNAGKSWVLTAATLKRTQNSVKQRIRTLDRRPQKTQARCVIRNPHFLITILETKIVVAHIDDGHVYHFPILPDGTVGLHEGSIKPNPDAKRAPRQRLFDAHNAATAAYNRQEQTKVEVAISNALAARKQRPRRNQG